MDESRIGELHLRVRGEGDAADLRERAEWFTREVLGRAVELLEARAPGRLIFLRRLPLRWSLAEDELADGSRVEDSARELAEAIERRLPAGTSLVADRGDIVAFDSEITWRAAHLLSHARGESAFCFASLAGEGEPAAALARSGRALVEAVLARLDAAGVLVEVLAALSEEAVARLIAAVAGTTETPPPTAARGRTTIEMPAPGSPGPHAASSVERAARAQEPHESTAARGSAAVSEADAQGVAQLAALGGGLPRRLGPAAHQLAVLVRARAISPGVVAGRAGSAVATTPAVPGRSRSPEAGPSSATTARNQPSPVDRPPDALQEPLLVTRFGGLLYLYNLLLELGLGEALWTACLPEGVVFARAGAALLEDRGAGDPAPALLGGTEPDGALEVGAAQHEEVAQATLAAVVRALPRRGLAALPELILSLVDHPAGRLLTAAAAGSPFALLAWPATTRDQLEAGVAAIAAGWPDSAPPVRAPAALAQLDPRGRIRTASGPQPRPILPLADDAYSAALLALTLGAPCHLFAARAGLAPAAAGDLVAACFAIPARVRLTPEAMRIILPIDRTDLRLRLAGLDRNPGWVPWLRRTVRFEFEGNRLE